MKSSTIFLIAVLSTSCAYNYQVGVPNGESPSEVATMTFESRYKVSKIDEKNFSRKFSLWDSTHTVKLKPGTHSFTLTYRSIDAPTGGTIYTTSDSIVSADMKPGKHYEIQSDFTGASAIFYIKEIATPEKTKP